MDTERVPELTGWGNADPVELEVLQLLASGHAAVLLKEENADGVMAHFIQKADSLLQNEIPYTLLARMYYRWLWESAHAMAVAAVTLPDTVEGAEV